MKKTKKKPNNPVGYAEQPIVTCPRCKKVQKIKRPYPPWGYLHHCDCGEFITEY